MGRTSVDESPEAVSAGIYTLRKGGKGMKHVMKALTVLMVLITLMTPVFSAGTQETDEVTLEIYHHKIPWIDAWEQMSEEYEAMTGNVSIENEVVGGASDWRTLLKTRFAAGKAPDIFIIEGYSDYQLWKEYIEVLDDQPWVENMLPIAEQAARQDGKVIGIPVTIEGYGYIYNKDLFKKAGITVLPTNLSEMRQTARKLKAAGITPFSSGFGTWWVISNHFTNIPFAQQKDPMGFINALNDGTARIADNEEFRNFEDAFDLVLANSEASPLTTDHHAQVTMFANEEVAMIQQGNWKQAPILETNPDIDMGLLPIFTSDDSEKANRIPVGIPFMFVINSQSPEAEKEAAKDFINWMLTSEEGNRYLAEEFQVIPSFDSIEASDSMGGVSKDILAFATEGKTIPWMFSYWPDGAVNEFSDIAQRYVAGQDSFSAYLNNLQEAWDRLK